MADEMTKDDFISLLSSSDPFDNSEALAILMDIRDFSKEFTDLALEISKKDETVAFHFPIASLADAYLCLAGIKDRFLVGDRAQYLLSGYEDGAF